MYSERYTVAPQLKLRGIVLYRWREHEHEPFNATISALYPETPDLCFIFFLLAITVISNDYTDVGGTFDQKLCMYFYVSLSHIACCSPVHTCEINKEKWRFYL